MPRTPLLRLLLALSAAAAGAGAPGPALPPITGDATLAVVFDVTGSMWDDLMQVIDGASRILERSLSHRSQVIANYALVPFHDPGSAPRRPLRAPRRGSLFRSPAACAPRRTWTPWAARHLSAAPSPHSRSSRSQAPGQPSQPPLPVAGNLLCPPPTPPGRPVRLVTG